MLALSRGCARGLARRRLPLPLGATVAARQRRDDGAADDLAAAGVTVELDPAWVLVELDLVGARRRRERLCLALDVVLARVGPHADAQHPLDHLRRCIPGELEAPFGGLLADGHVA